MRPDPVLPKNHAQRESLPSVYTRFPQPAPAPSLRRLRRPSGGAAVLGLLRRVRRRDFEELLVLALLVVDEHEHLRRADDADGRREELEPDVPLLLRRDAQAALLEREELGAVCRQVEHAVVRVRVRQGYLRSGRPRF